MDTSSALSAERCARFRAALDTLAPDGRIGVAVSGGPDSLALLLLTHAVRPGETIAATVDHGLRPEAAQEAAMVAEICASLGVPHATLPVTVGHDPAGVQAAARKARYMALAVWAEREGACFLATAHHADDQAETLLMRLARGAGLAGLAGVRRSRPLTEVPDVTLIRPLLDWCKAELGALVEGAGLSAVQDPSNHDPHFDRTRARALLADGWPDRARFAASARHLAEAEDALAWSAQRLAEERVTATGDSAEIDMTGLPREYRRLLLLAALAALAPEVEPRGDSLDRLLHALDRGEVATLAGFRFEPGSRWRVTRAPPRRS